MELFPINLKRFLTQASHSGKQLMTNSLGEVQFKEILWTLAAVRPLLKWGQYDPFEPVLFTLGLLLIRFLEAGKCQRTKRFAETDELKTLEMTSEMS